MTSEHGLRPLADAVVEMRERNGQATLLLNSEQFKGWFFLLLGGFSALEEVGLRIAQEPSPLSIKSCDFLDIAIAGGPRAMARIQAKGVNVEIWPTTLKFEQMAMTIKNSRTPGKLEVNLESIKVLPETVLFGQVDVVKLISDKIGGEKVNDELQRVLIQQLAANDVELQQMEARLTERG